MDSADDNFVLRAVQLCYPSIDKVSCTTEAKHRSFLNPRATLDPDSRVLEIKLFEKLAARGRRVVGTK